MKGCEGPVMVEPLQSILDSFGIEMEHMLVEPDRSEKVSIVVANPSLSVLCLDTGQCLGSAHVFEEWVPDVAGEVSVASDEVVQSVEVCHVDVNQSEVGVVHKRKERLSGLLNLKLSCLT